MARTAAPSALDHAHELGQYILLCPNPTVDQIERLTQRLRGGLRRLTQILVAIRFLQDHYRLGFTGMDGSGISRVRLSRDNETLGLRINGIYQARQLAEVLGLILERAGLTEVRISTDRSTGEWFVTAQTAIPATNEVYGY